jgi:hypothetical protein
MTTTSSPTGVWSDATNGQTLLQNKVSTGGMGPPVRCRPKRSAIVGKRDLGQRAVLNPIVEDGHRPRAVRAMADVELVHEDGEHMPALHRIGDDRGRRLQVGHDAVLEVERELRPGSEVSQPVPSLRCRFPLR